MIRKCLIAAPLAAVFGIISCGQFSDSSTGLRRRLTAKRHAGGDGHDHIGNSQIMVMVLTKDIRIAKLPLYVTFSKAAFRRAIFARSHFIFEINDED